MNIFHRLQDSLGLNRRFDEIDYNDLNTAEFYYPNSTSMGIPTASTNVVGMPSLPGGPSEVVLMQPRSFEEVPKGVMALRHRKTLILNVGLLPPEQAQRCVDYVAGAACAIDGRQERIGESVFLFTPSSVSISSYSEENLAASATGIPQPMVPASPF
jgi:cell division inhibitor SepF